MRGAGSPIPFAAWRRRPTRPIDDASTDDSILEIDRSGLPVTLLHVAARNAAAARNAGIEAASGDWIALLDADDVWYPNQRQCISQKTFGNDEKIRINALFCR
jgi:hypothetical protein